MTTELAGLVFLVGGGVALAFVSFSARQAMAAFTHALGRPLPGEEGRRARVFWEAMARNLIVLGALLAPLGFLAVLSHGEGFPPMFQLMGEWVFGPFVAGLGLAIVCALPASRGQVGAESVSSPAVAESAAGTVSPSWLSVETVLGWLVLALLVARVVLVAGDRPGFRASEWLLHVPALLTVAAGAIAFSLYRGEIRDAASVTLALGGAGGAAALLGLLRALAGFASSRIEAVAGGLVFAFSACVATLLGLAVLGLPREDRALGQAPGSPARLVWYGFPLLTILIVAIAWLMVATPMKVQ